MTAKRGRSTADRILDAAERLVQMRGFNAFSYADVAKAVGIRKASLHHHFPTKAHLGAALVARYGASFSVELAAIDAGPEDVALRLRKYIELYGSVVRRNRMCLCGMLASDFATLPKAMREGIAGFFAENETWLEHVLEKGRERGELRFEGSPPATAAFFVSLLEGAMLVARGSGSPEHFDHVVRRLLENVLPARSGAAKLRTVPRGTRRPRARALSREPGATRG